MCVCGWFKFKKICGIWGLEPFLEGLGFKIEEWTYG